MRVAVRVVFPSGPDRCKTWYLTTDHAMSSHGLPVLIDPKNNAYGRADLPVGTVLRIRSQHLFYAEGARLAGYTVED